jgi:putative RecB family exonuclease
VHRALELLFMLPPPARTLDAALDRLGAALAEMKFLAEYQWLQLSDDDEREFADSCTALVRRYFTMEDPSAIREIGLELKLEVAVGHLRLRGIIDRLELDEDGEFVVTDYKTGRPPFQRQEQAKLGGVHFYAFMCQELFGKRPSRVQLMYLSTGETIIARPSEQSVRFLPKRTLAVYSAVEKACAVGDFKARPGALCAFCSFQAWCPAFGGDPELAATEAPEVYAGLIKPA